MGAQCAKLCCFCCLKPGPESKKFLNDESIHYELEGKQKEVDMLKTRVNSLESELERVRSRHGSGDSLSSQTSGNLISELQKESLKKEASLSELTKENENLKSELKFLQQAQKGSDGLTLLQKQSEGLISEKAKLQKEVDELKNRERKNEEEKLALKSEVEKLRGEIENLRLQHSEANEKLKTSEAPGEKIEEERKRIYSRRIEEFALDNERLKKQLEILLNEIDRLTSEADETQEELEMYKKKYLEFSNMVEQVHSTLFHYVLASAQIEALQIRLNEGNGEEQKERRQSLTEKLKLLESQKSNN